MTDQAEVIEKPKARKAKATAKSKTKPPPNSLKNLKPFKPGQSGNPAGPKAGYRQEFSRSFVSDIAKDFAKEGTKVIRRVRMENPLGYLRVCASLVDQEINIKTPFSHLDHLSDDELRASIAELNERVVQALSGAGGKSSRDAAPGQPQQVGRLPTVLKAT